MERRQWRCDVCRENIHETTVSWPDLKAGFPETDLLHVSFSLLTLKVDTQKHISVILYNNI